MQDINNRSLIEALWTWMEAEGAVRLGIMSGEVADGGRGVIASEVIQPGTTVLTVPHVLLLTAGQARDDPAFSPALKASGSKLTAFQVLGAYLLFQASKGQASRWAAYLPTLPRSYTTFACFSPEEAAQLQVPMAIEAAQRVAREVRDQHSAILPLLRALGLRPALRTLRAWNWAASTLASRTMYLAEDDVGALVPYGDLHNHASPPPAPLTPNLVEAAGEIAGKPPAEAAAAREIFVCAAETVESGSNDMQIDAQDKAGSMAEAAGARPFALEGKGEAAAEVVAAGQEGMAEKEGDRAAASNVEGLEGFDGTGRYDEVKREYHIVVGRRYEAGEQVMLNYGRHSNLELLNLYGFVLDHNPHDAALLPSHLLPPSLHALAAGGEGGGAYLFHDGSPSWGLLRMLRLSCATQQERKQRAYLAMEDRAISAASEANMLRTLRTLCIQMLRSLPTRMEEDEALLAAPVEGGAQGDAMLGVDVPSEGGGIEGTEGGLKHLAQSSACARVAVQWRLEYKRVLGRGIALCDAALRVLGQCVKGDR